MKCAGTPVRRGSASAAGPARGEYVAAPCRRRPGDSIHARVQLDPNPVVEPLLTLRSGDTEDAKVLDREDSVRFFGDPCDADVGGVVHRAIQVARCVIYAPTYSTGVNRAHTPLLN